MPRSPKGGKRPADVTSNAVLVMRIATGEAKEDAPKTRRAEGGKVGGVNRAKKLTPEQRKQIAENAAKSRWADKKG